MLDLFSGLGGASSAMRSRGWRVLRMDFEPKCRPDVLGDVRRPPFAVTAGTIDLLWGSPPCAQFTRTQLPYRSVRLARPDLSLVEAYLRLVAELAPRYWVLENVRGAKPWLRPLVGEPRLVAGPFHFWGDFPPVQVPHVPRGHKAAVSRGGWRRTRTGWSRRAANRAKIPAAVSKAFAEAVEGSFRW